MYLIDDRAVVWAQSLLLNQYATLPLMKNMNIYAGSKGGVTEGFEEGLTPSGLSASKGNNG